jgi:anti-sigma factor RsiW
MKCRAFEPLIALDVTGDLRQPERDRVAAHLETCANCQALAAELRDGQSMANLLRSHAVPSTALSAVRERILDEVAGLEPAPAWLLAMHRVIFAGLRRKTAIAGMGLIAIISGSLWYGQPPVAVLPTNAPAEQMARIEMPPPVDIPSAVPVLTPQSVARLQLPKPLVVAPPSEPQSNASPEDVASEASQIPMKFVTDDPDIIIYWLPNDKGD